MITLRAPISAAISLATRERVENYLNAHGLEKGHLVEEALLHHLRALEELPSDIVIPPRITVSEETGRTLRQQVENPRAPTSNLEDLFKKKQSKASS